MAGMDVAKDIGNRRALNPNAGGLFDGQNRLDGYAITGLNELQCLGSASHQQGNSKRRKAATPTGGSA